MRFYYMNSCGDEGFFSEKNLVKAIYTAWNIEAELYLIKKPNIKKINWFGNWKEECQLIFCPLECNEFNTELLKELGYKMIDGEKYREIVNIKTNKIEKFEWSEVKQLI